MARKPTASIVWNNGLPFVRYTFNGKRLTPPLFDESGARIKSRAGAEAERKRVQACLDAGENPYPERVTLRTALEGYLAYCETKDDPNSERTIQEKRKTIGYFLDAMESLGISQVPDVLEGHAKAYLANLRKSARWRNLCRNYNSAFFDYCVMEKLTARNPFAATKGTRLPKLPPKAIKDLGDIEKLLSKAPANLHFMVKLHYYTGLRPIELCSLRWQDLHLQHGYADVFTRKGGKTRPVPIPADLCTELDQLRAVTGVCFFLRKRARHAWRAMPEYVFYTHHYNPWNCNTYNNALEKACEAAKVPKFTGHQFRHTAITESLRAGADLAAVRDLAGHHSIAVTNIYTHSNPVAVQRAASVIPKIKVVTDSGNDG